MLLLLKVQLGRERNGGIVIRDGPSNDIHVAKVNLPPSLFTILLTFPLYIVNHFKRKKKKLEECVREKRR